VKQNLFRILSLAIILSGLVLCVYPVEASPQIKYLTEKELVNIQDAKTVIDKIQPYQSVKVGSSVIINTDAGDIIATPHTLNASGWVEVQYNPKTLTGDIDVSFGFDGKHKVQITKMKGDPEVDVSKSKSLEYKLVAGTNNWQTIKTQNKAVKGQWQVVKFWVELPFSGLNPIEGKYNIEVKADRSGVGSGIVLDPWYNSAWGYRQQLTVYGSNSGVQTNYQKLIRVYKGAGTGTAENIAQYTTNDDHTGQYARGTLYLAQSFTAESSVTIKKVWVKLGKVSSPAGSTMVAIRATNATFYPTGGNLCGGNITTNYISNTADWYEFDMGAGTALTSGTSYAVVMFANSSNATAYAYWSADLTSAVYAGGMGSYTADGGTTWTSYLPNVLDYMFQTESSIAGATPLAIYCGGNCKDDFSDIRFTTSSGDVLLDYWIESYVSGNYADIWVETDTIAQMTSLTEHTHFYVYYGNSSATSQYATTQLAQDATFLLGDEFGGVALDGAKWPTVGGAGSATVGGGYLTMAAPYYVGTSVAYTGGYASRARIDTGAVTTWQWWYGFCVPVNSVAMGRTIEDINFFSYAFFTFGADNGVSGGGYITTLAQDAGIHVADIMRTGTVDIFSIDNGYIGHGGYPTNAARYLSMYAFSADMIVDWIFVRKFTTTEPLWGVPTAEESLTAPTLVTLRCTGFGDNWLLLNGNVTAYGSMVNITQLGFNYGTTASYGSTILTSYTNYTLRSYGYYQYLNSLNTATMYNFRATGYNGSWGYGANRQFSTGGASVEWPWEMNVAAVNTTWQIYGSNWAFQRYTTNVTAHTFSSIDLWFTRTGSPGDVLITTQAVGADGLPYGAALNTGTIPAQYTGNINPISSNTTTRYNVKFDKEVSLSPNTTYAFTVKALMGDTSNYIQMANVNTGTYPYGTGYRSTNSGLTWIDTDTDFLFDLWGRSCLQVDFGKVFMGYKETGDWLFVFAYDNVYPPYYPEQDSKQKFVYQLVDYYNEVKAQSPCASWGLRPGSIYLSATSVVPLQWGGAYRLRLTNIADGTIYMEYPLQSADWQGTDMTLLDSWCLSVAQKIGTFYNTPMITSVAGRGNVLNQQGGVMFATGIPLLDSLRPNVFQIATTAAATSTGTYPQTMRQVYNPAAMLGADAFVAMTSIGNVFGVDGRTIGFAGLLMMTLVIAGWGFQPGHTIAATIIASIMFVLAMLVGLLDLLIGALLLAICVIILVWQGVFRGG
jgi:hypothetical protein